MCHIGFEIQYVFGCTVPLRPLFLKHNYIPIHFKHDRIASDGPSASLIHVCETLNCHYCTATERSTSVLSVTVETNNIFHQRLSQKRYELHQSAPAVRMTQCVQCSAHRHEETPRQTADPQHPNYRTTSRRTGGLQNQTWLKEAWAGTENVGWV